MSAREFSELPSNTCLFASLSRSLPRHRTNTLPSGSPLSSVNLNALACRTHSASPLTSQSVISRVWIHLAGIADTLLAALPTQVFLPRLSFVILDSFMIALYLFHTVPAIRTPSNRQVFLTLLRPCHIQNFIPFSPFILHQICLVYSIDR